MQPFTLLVFLAAFAAGSTIDTSTQTPITLYTWVLVCLSDWTSRINCGPDERPNSKNCKRNCVCTPDGDVLCEKDFGECSAREYTAICGQQPISPCTCELTVNKHAAAVVEAPTPKKDVKPAAEVLECDLTYTAPVNCGPDERPGGRHCKRSCHCTDDGTIVCPNAFGTCSAQVFTGICRIPCVCETTEDASSSGFKVAGDDL